jgi:TRAP-type C4-dicarboxylate transport system permease small subunit
VIHIRKLLSKSYKIASGIGIFAVGLMAGLVIFCVIFRYFFSISFMWIEEVITKLFVFTTFWGVGICIVENEHIIIDYFVNKMSARMRKWVMIVNYVLTLALMVVMLAMSFEWIATVGEQLTLGLRIPGKYLYVLMPVSLVFIILCTLYKIIVTAVSREVDGDERVK